MTQPSPSWWTRAPVPPGATPSSDTPFGEPGPDGLGLAIPDLSAVDRQICDLYRGITRTCPEGGHGADECPEGGHGADHLWAQIDHLLDLRNWLRVTCDAGLR